jgi:hypothetical protein
VDAVVANEMTGGLEGSDVVDGLEADRGLVTEEAQQALPDPTRAVEAHPDRHRQ